MQKAGAAGEVAGWVYDGDGHYIDVGTAQRTGGIRVEPHLNRPAVGVAAGPSKVLALAGALRGRILNALVTDEDTARALLALD